MAALDELRQVWSPTFEHDLSTGERAVLTTLLLHRNGVTGRCFPGQSRIGAAIGVTSLNGVRPHIRRLIERGIVERRQESGRPPEYTLHLDRLDGLRKGTGSEKVPVQKRHRSQISTQGVRYLNVPPSESEPELVSNCEVTVEENSAVLVDKTDPSAATAETAPITTQDRAAAGQQLAATRTARNSAAAPHSNGRGTSARHHLPEGWQPNEKHRALAGERAVDIEEEAEKMRDWAASKAEKKADWDAAFRNWLRNATPSRNGARPKPTEYTENDDLPWRREASA